MTGYRFPLVPGPTSVDSRVLNAFSRNYPSGDLEPAIFTLLKKLKDNLCQICGWNDEFIFITGEAMACLWGGIKSLVNPGDKIIAVDTGLFGRGIGQMAASCKGNVTFTDFFGPDFYSSFSDLLKNIQPQMVTLVHCETPAGIITPLHKIGSLIKDNSPDTLFFVDAVASIGSMPINASYAGVDVLLGGSQKALSCPPDMGFIGLSSKGAKKALCSDYQGYDSLCSHLPGSSGPAFPYTPNWHGLAALSQSCGLLVQEGLDMVWQRHKECSDLCIKNLADLDIKVYKDSALAAPGVTAAFVPSSIYWPDFDLKLRENGIALGGNYGDLANRVFRIGHMGTQARPDMIKEFFALFTMILNEYV
jgi:aspartate aminotransferase-like enzyme